MTTTGVLDFDILIFDSYLFYSGPKSAPKISQIICIYISYILVYNQ